MLQVSNTMRETNISGFVDRVERNYTVKHETTHYRHVRSPLIVQKPQIEDLNNLIVVHDLVEEYA